MAYTKTNWQDGVTPLSATNMNKLEEGVRQGQLASGTELGSENKIVYGCETVDEALLRNIPLSSFMAFCSNVNAVSIDVAFGKGIENEILLLGKQLALYSWFMGESKIAHPFTNLVKHNNLTSILNDFNAYNEVVSSPSLSALFTSSAYASPNFIKPPEVIAVKQIASYIGESPDSFETFSSLLLSGSTNISNIAGSPPSMDLIVKYGEALKVICSNSTPADGLKVPLQSRRATIVNTLNNSLDLFNKAEKKYLTVGGTAKYSGDLNTNTIQIPIRIDNNLQDPNGHIRYLWYGTDLTYKIFEKSEDDMYDVTAVTSSVSMRGIGYSQSFNYNSTNVNVVCDVYTVK